MPDNYNAKDQSGATVIFDAKDTAGVKRPRTETYTPDGADVVAGLTTDTAVTGDNPGTLSAKLRGLNKFLASVFPSVVGRRARVDSLSVTFSSDGEPVILAPGSAVVGAVKDAGPLYTPVPIRVTSPDASGGVDLTTAPGAGFAVVDDLVLSTDTDCEIFFYNNSTAGTYLGGLFMKASVAIPIPRMKNGLRGSVAANKIVAKTSVASKLRAFGGWHEET